MITDKQRSEAISKIMKKNNTTPEKAREIYKKMVANEIRELNDLITEEGAECIILQKLGVMIERTSVQPHTSKINEIEPNMWGVTITGRVTKIDEIRNVQTANGLKSVVNIIITDQTGSIPLTLWDEYTNLIKSGKIAINDIVRVTGAYSKEDGFRKNFTAKLNISKKGNLEVNPPDVDAKSYPIIKTIKTDIENLADIEEPLVKISLSGRVTKLFNAEPKITEYGSAYIGGILSDKTGDTTFNIYGSLDEIKKLNIQVGTVIQSDNWIIRDPWMDGTPKHLALTTKSGIKIVSDSKQDDFPQESKIKTSKKAVRKSLVDARTNDVIIFNGIIYNLQPDPITDGFYRMVCPVEKCSKGVSVTNDDTGEHYMCKIHGEVSDAKAQSYMSGLVSDGTLEIQFRAYGKPVDTIMEKGKSIDDICNKIFTITGRISENPNNGKLGLMILEIQPAQINEETNILASKIYDLLMVQGK